MAPQLDGYFKEVDRLSESFIERLRKAVAIPSVSAEDERRQDVIRVSFHQLSQPSQPLTYGSDVRIPRSGTHNPGCAR